MNSNLVPKLQDKTPWLNPEIQKDEPISLFKPLTQILSENIHYVGLFVIIGFCIFIPLHFLRKRDHSLTEEVVEVPVDPYEEAIRSIADLQSSKPALQPKPFVFRLSEILRVYVEKRFKVPAMELTGEEFMREIVSHAFFRNRYEKLLGEFVDRGDRVKYSKEIIDEEEMNQLLNTALHFVEDTHLKLQEQTGRTQTSSERSVNE